MDIAQCEDLRHRQALRDQLLFDLHHLVVRNLAQVSYQLLTDCVGCRPSMQLQNHVLEKLLAPGCMYEQFAHRPVPPVSRLPTRLVARL
jgi:hypothetical protein